jgi:hypothetical protein
MSMTFTGEDRVLLDRYVESVLLRFNDGRYSLQDATQTLSEIFIQVGRGGPDVLTHMRGVVEAGDDA